MVWCERSCHKEYTCEIYESPVSHGSEIMTKVKVFCKVGQTSRSRSLGQKLWYDVKGLVTRNTHMKSLSLTVH